MKIVVCIKQVPDTKGGVVFNPDGTLNRGAMLTIMNPDDKAGLEAALRIKEETGAEVTVLTMGLPKAEEVLREAMAMGADNGILVTDRVLGGADTWATSTTIAGALRNIDYDLIITGRQAIDGDTAQVGPQISEHLDIPVISYAQNIKVEGDSVIVALSGGADSTALLSVFVSLKEKYNLSIYAAHINHNIRGDEAKRDENFCKILCKKFNTELFIKSVDVPTLAKQQKISEELCGRNVRYAFFEELSQKLQPLTRHPTMPKR